MTAESGETWCAWRSTSMPSVRGILMSVMTTSYNAPSSFFFAASPELTVSTLCPSRRRAISSISQMERSSSQTRILPTRPSCRCRQYWCVHGHSGSIDTNGCRLLSANMPSQPQYEIASLSRFRTRPHFALVRLNDLVNNGQPEPCASLKLGLKGLKNLFDELRTHPRPRVFKVDLPVLAVGLRTDREGAPIPHGANCVFGKIPEDLLHLVAVGQGPCFFYGIVTTNEDARVLRREPVFQQCERVL